MIYWKCIESALHKEEKEGDKMKRKLRLMGILLLVLVMFLAACSSSESTGNEDSKNGKSGDETAEKQTISIVAGSNKNSVATDTADINKEEWVLKLEEETGVDLDFRLLQQENIREAIGIMFASGDIPDVLHTQQGMLPLDPTMAGSVEAGVFMPLNDLLEKYGQNLLKEIPQEAWDEVTVDGNIYAIPQYLSNNSRRGVVVRTDLMEKYGIETPETVDEFIDMLRVFKENGHDAPFGARSGFAYSQAIFGAYDVMFGNNMYEKVGDEIVPKFTDVENMTKALEAWKTMLDEGLVAPDFPSHGSSERGKNIDAGDTVVFEYNVNSLLSFEEKQQTNIDPERKWDVIPSPVGPDGKGGNMLYGATLRLNYVNADISEEKAEAIIKFFDWMVTEEGKTWFSFGIEGEDYEKDADGNIIFKEAETEEEARQAGFRNSWLQLVGDLAIDEVKTAQLPNGQKVFDAMELVSKEGREGISFVKPLEAYSINPDITPGFDTAPKLIEDAMIQMIYGKMPISDYPKVIEDWKAKGGAEVIKEATDYWNKQENIFRVGPDANVD